MKSWLAAMEISGGNNDGLLSGGGSSNASGGHDPATAGSVIVPIQRVGASSGGGKGGRSLAWRAMSSH